jgi:hypothetical protein
VSEPQSWTAFEVAIGACDPQARDDFHRRATDDPLCMLELADEVQFVAELRELRVETGFRYEHKLRQVLKRAERRVARPLPLARRPWFAVAAAAAVTFAALTLLDPWLRKPTASPDRGQIAAALPAPSRSAGERSAPAHPFAAEFEAIGNRIALEKSERLAAALLDDAERGGLGAWLAPRNALAVMHAEHEARIGRGSRSLAAARSDWMPGTDRRVAEFTEAIAAEVARRFAAEPFEAPLAAGELAAALRAMVVAGVADGTKAELAERTAARLVERLARADGTERAIGLVALIEYSAVSPDHVAAVADLGGRMVAELLTAGGDAWRQGRPDLLRATAPVAAVGEAARALGMLPAFGVDPARAALARRLVVAGLRERLDRGADGPECLAALLYGSAGVAEDVEREAWERRLRRWQPIALAPDYATLQQWSWGLAPGEAGYARLQRQLRPLATLAVATSVSERAGWVLCLATQSGSHPATALQLALQAVRGA